MHALKSARTGFGQGEGMWSMTDAENANEHDLSLHHFEPLDFDSKITNLMP
jgi:hypothetical protein